MRWLRTPLVHFVVGGAGLFWLLHGTSVGRQESAVAPVVLTAADVARLRSDYVRETGLAPTDADEAALVEKAVEEELLFREAVARGLDRNDRSVRNWLVEQMRVLNDDAGADPEHLYTQAQALGLDRTDLVVRRILVQKMRLLAARLDERPPSAEELAAFYAEHRDEYRVPDRVTFWHVFLSSDVRGNAVRGDARALLESLGRTGGPPVEAMGAGDTFAAPAHVVGGSPGQIARLFGQGFAAEIARVDLGTWVGPVGSPYGVHLVWVERREAGAPPPLDVVRGRVVERWQVEQRARRLESLLDDLGRRYPLQVESSAWRERGRT